MGLQRVGHDLVTENKKGKEESVVIIRAGVTWSRWESPCLSWKIVTDRDSWPYYRLIRSPRRNLGKPSLGPSLQQWVVGVKISNRFPLSLPRPGVKPVPHIRWGWGSGQRDGSGGLPTCFCDVECRVHVPDVECRVHVKTGTLFLASNTLVLLLALQKRQCVLDLFISCCP